MKKGFQLLYIVLFFALCAIPVWGLVATEGMPEDLTSSQQIDQFLEKDFFLRDNFLNLDATYKETLFHTASVDEVVVGKEDTLFFQETVEDFTGTNPLSENDLRRIGHTLGLIETYASSQGCQFIFTIAPNKNSIYPDLMPDHYLQSSEPRNAQALEPYLAELPYVNLFDVLSAAPQMAYLYRDSHWNNYGAYLGFQAMLDGLKAPEKLPEILDTTWRTDFPSDLEAMLYPLTPKPEAQVYFTFPGEYQFVSRYRGVDDLVIQTENSDQTGQVVVFRDSFGNALIDYFGHSFGSAYLSRAVPYDVDLATQADYMVLEIVERNLENLLSSAPVMPAPAVSQPENLTSVFPTFETTEKGDYTYICGYFPEADVSHIYLAVDDVFYETFQILDKQYTQQNNGDIIGFSAYLPKDIQLNQVKLYTN